jgi:phage terminase large subunit-like protein
VIVREEFYRDQLSKKPENVFRRYFLNEWTATTEVWLPPERWAACADQVEIPADGEVFVGVDIGLVNDSTAVAWAHPLEDGRVVVRTHVWSARGETMADVFVGGGRIQLGPIDDFIRSLATRYQLREVIYDPRFFERSAQALADEDGPGDDRARAELEGDGRRVQRVLHGRRRRTNRASERRGVERHVRGTAAELTDRGWRVRKLQQSQKIDALVAMVMASYRARQAPAVAVPLIEFV